MESVLKDVKYAHYDIDIDFYKDKTSVVKLDGIIGGIVKDLRNKEEVSLISGKIHETICRLIYKQADIYSKIYKTDIIALSGGVFQNKYILSRSIDILKKSGFKVYFNSLVPVNDGGIALGQSYICSNYQKLFV